MPVLHNRISNEELKARMLAETEPRTTVSFYKYFSIDDPKAFRDSLYVQFEKLKVFGRIYVAKEGINAQISVPQHHFDAFKAALFASHPALDQVRLNIALEDDGKSFWVLRLKVRERIVADGITRLNPSTLPDVGAVGYSQITVIDPGRMAELHNRLAAAAQRDGVLDVAYRTVDSPVGPLLLAATTTGLVRVAFEHVNRKATDKALRTAAKTLALYFPLGTIHYALWHLFIGLHVYEFVSGNTVSGSWVTALNFVAVTLLAPNAVRTFCLHFVSSNMHYYGDVEEHNVMQQTQVWTAKWLKPFHALCFNFGETHAIHHFLVRDPFYLREAIKHDCQKVLRDNGVRFNDFGTFQRANRFSLAPAHVEP